jgi:hypothetical protein
LWSIPAAFFANTVLASSGLIFDGVALWPTPVSSAFLAGVVFVTFGLAALSLRRRKAPAPPNLVSGASLALLLMIPSRMWSALLVVIVLVGTVLLWEYAEPSFRRLLTTFFAVGSVGLLALVIALSSIAGSFVRHSEYVYPPGPSGWSVVISTSDEGALGGSIDVSAEKTYAGLVKVILPLADPGLNYYEYPAVEWVDGRTISIKGQRLDIFGKSG